MAQVFHTLKKLYVSYPLTLTFGASVYDVIVYFVVAASNTDAYAELQVAEGVAVDLGIGRLEKGHAGVLHVVHVVVCPAPRNH